MLIRYKHSLSFAQNRACCTHWYSCATQKRHCLKMTPLLPSVHLTSMLYLYTILYNTRCCPRLRPRDINKKVAYKAPLSATLQWQSGQNRPNHYANCWQTCWQTHSKKFFYQMMKKSRRFPKSEIFLLLLLTDTLLWWWWF